MHHPLSEILGEKSGDVIRIDGDATVYEAVIAMVQANVGALLVTDGDEISGSSPSGTTCGGSRSRVAGLATRPSAR